MKNKFLITLIIIFGIFSFVFSYIKAIEITPEELSILSGQNFGAFRVFTIEQGGTGTSTSPTSGQLLVGNSDGTYDLIATSSLGITASASATWGLITGTLSDQTDLQNALNLKIDNSTTTLPLLTITESQISDLQSYLTSVSFGDLTDVATSSDATGDIYYLNSSGQLTNLGVGTGGYVLTSANGLPAWNATTTPGTGLSYSGGAFNVNTSQNIAILSNLTDNGYIKTTGGTGTLSVVSTIGNADLTNSTIGLTSSGSITIGTSPISLGGTSALNLNMANANTWTGLQTFANASSTLFSTSYASSTSLYAGTSYIPNLGTSAGAFLAVDANGQIIATTTPSSGGTPGGTDGQMQYNNGGAFGGASGLFYDDINNYVGIGTTTPTATLTVKGADRGVATDVFQIAGSDDVSMFAMYGSGSIDIGGVSSTTPANRLTVYNGGTEMLKLMNTGTLNIGSNPNYANANYLSTQYLLNVNGVANFNNAITLGTTTARMAYYSSDGTVSSSTKISELTGGGPSLDDSDLFGASVANIGDLNGDGITDLAVGAYADEGTGTSEGAVHILFMNTDGTAQSTAKISDGVGGGPSLDDSDSFGFSVTNIGDLNGDGITDLAVGAYTDEGTGTSEGAVHILFMNTDGTAQSTAKISDGVGGGPSLDDSDYFGISVTNIGDLNGDGITDLAVGARSDDDGGTDRGALYILSMNDTSRIRFATNNSERLTILNNGNVGIGTTTPWGKLAVENTGTGYSFIVNDVINDTSPFVIDASGKVGIGTAAPQAGMKMDVRSEGSTDGSSAITAYGYNGNGGMAIRGYGYATTGTGINYGLYGQSVGARATGSNIGGYFTASGAASNYALITGNGNVGIGTSTPAKTFTVNGQLFIDGADNATSTIQGNLINSNDAGTYGCYWVYSATSTQVCGAL